MPKSHTFKVIIIIGIYLLSFTSKVSGTCTWPSYLANSTWSDSRKGELVFASDTMTGWSFTVSSTSITRDSWQCHTTYWLTTDSYLVMRTTDSFELYSSTYYGYICLKLKEVTSGSYRVYIYDPEQQTISGAERMLVSNDANIIDKGIVCTEDYKPEDSEYQVMIKTGSEMSAKIPCPYVFLGKYDYTYTSSNGAVTCDTSTDTWDTCTDNTQMTFSYDTCSTKVPFSESNTVWCVDTVSYGNDNYITTYNGNDDSSVIDDVIIYRFSCVAISYDATQASVTPNSCIKGQSSTSYGTSSPGATLSLTRAESCPSCPPSSAPDSGTVSYSTDGAVTMATFNCSVQYSLAGAGTSTCQSDLTWSEDTPTCTCILPDAPNNGVVTVSDDGVTVTYTCNVGFVLVGTSTRTCQANSNTWSGSESTCDACSNLVETDGLVITQGVTGSSTIAQFTCTSGYTISGATTSTCTSTGSWSDATPSCVLCASITTPSSGTSLLSTDGYITMATFSCSTGYSLVGETALTCDVTGTWSDVQPSCECESPASIDNGISTGNGSDATYTCNVGYNLIGSQTRICTEDGTGWSDTAPSCAVCNAVTSPADGYFNQTTDASTTSTTFSCLVGFTLTGDRTSYCQSDGSWNSSEPTCVQCNTLQAPSSGTVTITTDGNVSTATYACATDYVISGDSVATCNSDGTWTSVIPTCLCSPVTIPTHGSVVDDGTTMTYTCDVGYTLAGDDTRKCSNMSAGWSSTDPSCELCPTFNIIFGGTSTLSSNGTVTVAAVTCDVGYTLDGDDVLTCLADGTWDKTQPTCALCTTITSPIGGNVTLLAVNATVTMATVTCDVGYTLSGTSSLTCGSDGEWDQAIPTCAECSVRQPITSGDITMATDGQTTTVSYTCMTGYYLDGDASSTCLITGSWSNTEPSCICSTPVAPTNGAVESNVSSVMYTCDVGYTLVGESYGTCATDGTGWSVTTPSCVQCDAVAEIPDGTVSMTTDGITTQATYACSLGTSLLGSTRVSCSPNGLWETSQPDCVSCPSLPNISSGNVVMSTNGTTTIATYSCAIGYYISGTATSLCTTSGSWEFEASSCICDAPNYPTGGNYTLSSDGQTVTYTCDVGYTISGNEMITCVTDGSGWSTTQPTCTTCTSLESPAGGVVSLTTSGTMTSSVYTCDEGYSLDGVSVSTCQSDGTWNITSGPTCVSCPTLSNLDSGTVTVSTDGLSTTAVNACVTGYALVGTTTSVCLTTGQWSSSQPVCNCEDPPLPTNGNITVSDDGSMVTYSCYTGYNIKGSVTRTCQSTGMGWSDSAPICTSCTSITKPANGDLVLSTDGSITDVTFTCDVGFTLDGNTIMQCLDDGSWTGNIPTCVSCPSVTSPSSGHVVQKTDGVTTVANYSCVSDYRLLGDSYLVCTTTGVWNTTVPTCVCSTLTSPANGSVSVSTDQLTAVYTCDTGYTLNGESVRTCGTDGTGWTDSDPTCVLCPSLTETVSGQHVITSNGTMSSAVFTCDVGSTLQGSSSTQCTRDGTWTDAQPSCVSCPTLTSPASGNVTLTTDGITTGSAYACATGYEVIGDALRQCLTTGSWSSDEPTCNCVPPGFVSGGSMALSNNNMTLTYTCDLHFTLSGDQERTCAQDGTGWTGTQPTCVSCDSLSSPTNGTVTITTTGTQTIATVTCEVGTSINGEPVNYCQSDVTWSSQQPVCVTCASLADIDSGSIIYTTDGLVTTATYTCSNGYYVNGNTNISCTSGGTWDLSSPSCLCNTPAEPTNGSVTSDGSSASYTCSLGYTLNGDVTRTCADDGTGWTGSDPQCSFCEILTSPSNGSLQLSTNGSVTKANVQCTIGTSIAGTLVSVCDAVGQWDTAAPMCVTCNNLQTPPNGEFVFASDGATTTVILQCAEGYTASGTTSYTCQADGTWSELQDALTCDKNSDTGATTSLETSLLIPLIAVSVLATILAVLLALFVYLYCRRPTDTHKYMSQNSYNVSKSASLTNGKIEHLDEELDYQIPIVQLSPASAPVSHQRHVTDLGRLSTSPAPANYSRHVTENGSSPRSPPPMETDFSMSRSSTVMTRSVTSFSSAASISSVNLLPPIDRNANKLQPIPTNQKKSLNKAFGSNTTSNITPTLTKKSSLPVDVSGRTSPFPHRPSTPVNHSFYVDVKANGKTNDLVVSEVD